MFWRWVCLSERGGWLTPRMFYHDILLRGETGYYNPFPGAWGGTYVS
jgi:hypothetical protein